MGVQVHGKTRWRWFALPFVPALGGMVFMLALIMSGGLAFNISGVPFVLHATTLAGTGFVQYAEPDQITITSLVDPFIDSSLSGSQTATTTDSGNTYAADTVTQFDTATISGLVQTVCAPVFAGKDLLVVTEGGASAPNGLTAWAPGLIADSATFTNINIGEFDSSKLPFTAFTQHADSATISDVTQLGLGTSAATFQLTGLKVYASFVPSHTVINAGANLACP